MGRHGKSPAGTGDAHGRKVHGACRLQAGGDGGIRSHPLPAHSPSVRSPPQGWPATEGLEGVPGGDSPSPAIPCTSPCPPSPDLRMGTRGRAAQLCTLHPHPASPASLPASRITCIHPRIPPRMPHPSAPRPPPRYISRRPREARRADPRARARPPRALRHGGPGSARPGPAPTWLARRGSGAPRPPPAPRRSRRRKGGGSRSGTGGARCWLPLRRTASRAGPPPCPPPDRPAPRAAAPGPAFRPGTGRVPSGTR